MERDEELIEGKKRGEKKLKSGSGWSEIVRVCVPSLRISFYYRILLGLNELATF